MRYRAVFLKWMMLVALFASPAESLEGQSVGAHPSLTLYGGIAAGSGPGALLAGLELRTPDVGRLSLAAAGSTWWLVGVGCDQIIGAPCDRRAKALDLGPVVRITPRGLGWRVEATTRVGRLWYRGADRGVWNPSVGLGFRFGESRTLGGTLGVRYHALASGRANTVPYRPDTSDRIVATAGLALRF